MKDPELLAHLEWLGFLQPVGLVVSPFALLSAQAHVDRNVFDLQQRFLKHVQNVQLPGAEDAVPTIIDLSHLLRDVFGWRPTDLVAGAGLPSSLEVVLTDYQETLRPTFAVPEARRGDDGAAAWIMLIQTLATGADLDRAPPQEGPGWHASPQARFERLLRETHVPIGLLSNGTSLRLVYAPRGESSGHVTFPVRAMTETAGRPILAALDMLLCEARLFSLPEKQRLPAILAESRRFQNTVSTKLAGQVLEALYELLRGFQAADEQRHGELLRDVLNRNPDDVYAALLTVLLRLVFLLYAEDRGLTPSGGVFVNHYSVAGLFEQLRADAGRYPDTMDQRYGAWARLLTLFRLVHDGGSHPELRMPARKGHLFDPDRYPFLSSCQLPVLSSQPSELRTDNWQLPTISDGVLYRVLEKLLILDGERLAYSALEVEHIGSVYETMMGFRLEKAAGRSIAVRPAKAHGAPASINLDELLTVAAGKRGEWLKTRTDQTLTGAALNALKEATTPNDAVAALGRKVAAEATPRIVPPGAMVLQPSDERRRSGSHYTPRSLTEPIVRKALEPVLAGMGDGRSGVGDGANEEELHERQDSIVPGSSSLAAGHGPGGGLLPSDEEFSSGRTLRDDEPDSPGGRVDPGQHRGGPRSGLAEGVPPVPADGPGQPQGAGDPSLALRASSPLGKEGRRRSDAEGGSAGTDAPSAAKRPETRIPTPQFLTPSSHPTPDQILSLKICDPAMGSGAFLVEACRQLAEALVASWRAHKRTPAIPPDEDELLHARRLVAQRCLYGVDKNPIAVDLAKLSLWLATLAKDHPFTFLDHALRCGDSLVGLTREQIAGFHWKPSPQRAFDQKEIEDRIRAATRVRQVIIEAGDDVLFSFKEQKLAEAEESLNTVRFVGNLAVAAFFAEDNDRKRQTRRENLLGQLTEYLTKRDMTLRPTAAEAALLAGPKGIRPFHWEVEFPEVFSRDNPGFDSIVGNPPFAGKNTIIDAHADGYLDWLKAVHAESHGNADLVAHFFRRAFTLVRGGGTFGLIATNTIAQGDTRSTGLRWICTHGGTIYAARRRTKWPGQAAVVVSTVHVRKQLSVVSSQLSAKQLTTDNLELTTTLDGRPVPLITAYLFHAGGHENPATLAANANKSFIGSYVLGMGFTFDDTDKDGVASPIAEMHRLIEKDPRNAERIFPYIGGEEVNDSPTHAHHRYVINFGDMTEAEARRWPDLMAIVEEKVKPQRMNDKREVRKKYWWRFGETTPALFAAIRGLDRVIVVSRVGEHGGFAFLPTGLVVSEGIVVFVLPTYAALCILQSRVHAIWARFFGSSLEERFRYTPSDCFETFPFPIVLSSQLSVVSEELTTENWQLRTLEDAGRAYYEFRAALMVRNAEGLTKTYNRFHDPDERSADIVRLRELHAAMDRAVLDAYGWSSQLSVPSCQFLLDYEEESEGELRTDNRQLRTTRKKPWRYRWPDDLRDEVLAKLLELNKRRAEEEALAGAAAGGKKKRGGKKPPEGPRLL